METKENSIKCEICGGYITDHDSCECGTTMRDLKEQKINENDLAEAWEQ